MYIEDIFTKFFKRTVSAHYQLLPFKDYEVCYSFYQSIIEGKHFTENQRTYVLALLSRYKGLSRKVGFDYQSYLITPEWKHAVRVVNKERTIWVTEEDSALFINLRFPFQLKEPFDNEIEKIYNGRSVWDYDTKVRKLKAYNINLLALNDFIEKHGFEQQQSYAELFASYEECVRRAESIVPYATVGDGIELVNCAESAEDYFNEHKTDNHLGNILLLKLMGVPLIMHNPVEPIEVIATESTNSFWIPNMHTFLDTAYSTTGRVGIVLDRQGSTLEWLQKFFEAFNEQGRNPQDVKVCIKEGRHQNRELNKWLYDNKKAGTNKSKFLIFLHKPAKWIFKDNIEFALVGTNALYPSTNTLTNNWLMSHSCASYLTDILPSVAKGQHIAKL